MAVLKIIARPALVRSLFQKIFEPGTRQVTVFGLTFKNPVGLAAGFDKNAKFLDALTMLGFGFVEIGTVTPVAQEGNLKPRLFRLPKDKAIINRMGFNNDGMEVIGRRLQRFKSKNKELIIGGNIGKNKVTPNEDAWMDYEKCFKRLFDVVDYFVVNVSSPNTPGLRDLQQKDVLKRILVHLQNINKRQPIQKPILLKIAPDLNLDDLDDIIDLCMEIKLDGLVATNTTISREDCISEKSEVDKCGNGGLSGMPLLKKSNTVLEHIHKRTGGVIPVVGSGGIMSAHDAQQKLQMGASLVQVYTGFIYEGPSIVQKIVRGITEERQ